MTDFDFDELDKAVTGALGTDTPEADAAEKAPKEVVSERPAQVEQPAPRDMESTYDTASRTAPALRRSSGRFMDVVHPSSDMRTRNSAPVGASSTDVSPTTFTPPTETPVVEEKAADTQTNEVTSSDTEWSQPLDSPFLPDAKVEKRPLGGVGPAPENDLMLEEPDEPRIEAHAMPDPIDFAVSESKVETAPESVEGPEDIALTAVEDSSVVEAEALQPEAPIESPLETPVETVVEASVESSMPASEAPTGPTSITQQYEERPSTEQASGAIYDTEAYHQPLVTAGKKHSGLWTVLWIFLLVVLGAGVGVVFYLFVLPML